MKLATWWPHAARPLWALLLGAAAAAAAQTPSAVPSAAAPTLCRQIVASGNPQYPPYLWPDPSDGDRLVGAAAEMARWLSHEIGLPIQVRHIGPWGRVQQEAQAGAVDMIVGAFFTLPRTEYMDYFHPAFRETRSVVFVPERSTLALRRWDDLVPLRGVTVIRNSFGEAFDRFARERLKFSEVASLEQAIELLARGRADYLVYEDKPAQAFLARLGATGVKELPTAVATESLYVTLSHRSPCNTPEIRGRLQRALYKLAREKAMDGFVERAIERWKKPGG
jgi:polar amino acid transport system substrate-binding protein